MRGALFSLESRLWYYLNHKTFVWWVMSSSGFDSRAESESELRFNTPPVFIKTLMRNLSSAVGQLNQCTKSKLPYGSDVYSSQRRWRTQDEEACIVLDTLSLPFFPPEIFFSHLSLWYSWSRLLWNTLDKFLHKPFTGPDPITSPCTTLTNMYVSEWGVCWGVSTCLWQQMFVKSECGFSASGLIWTKLLLLSKTDFLWCCRGPNG